MVILDLPPIFWSWLKSFAFTLAIEVPVFVLIARGKAPAWKAASPS